MEVLKGEEFSNLFKTFERTAFHLELKDSYSSPDEFEPYARFLQGLPDDLAWHQPWLSLIREATGQGKKISRARVVTVPHADYQRWGFEIAPANIAAGEEIRYLPRDQVSGIEFPRDDYWLFDDRDVVFSYYEDSVWAGGERETDPSVIELCRKAHELVWARAVPFDEYVRQYRD
jgi:hypothetical protein